MPSPHTSTHIDWDTRGEGVVHTHTHTHTHTLTGTLGVREWYTHTHTLTGHTIRSCYNTQY